MPVDEQQPVQLAGEQAWQVWLMQLCVMGHWSQSAPPLPHSSSSVPDTQKPLEQHPVHAPHFDVEALQTRLVQVPEPQSRQRAPLAPQEAVEVPASQRPSAVQQPLQVAAEHGVTVLQAP